MQKLSEFVWKVIFDVNPSRILSTSIQFALFSPFLSLLFELLFLIFCFFSTERNILVKFFFKNCKIQILN